MKGDFTRSTFDHTKHYSGVRMQQGRMQLDSDWNEQVDIQMHLRKQKTEDVVGLCGAPIGKTGFGLPDKGKLMIGAGHYYVHGILCENETECSFEEQDDYSDYMKLPDDKGYYLFYLDVWQRHITAVEDNSIREIALGGPDTATRIKTVWQVKWLKLTEDREYAETPCIEYQEWKELIKERNARLDAQTHEEPFENPCIVPPGAGYSGLENHLYRVEIHQRGKTGGATFKWSRDNGSIVCAVEKIEDDTITIINSGQDSLHAFNPEQWIEITDDNRELCGQPGTLVRLTQVIDGLKLSFNSATIIGDPINITNYPVEYNPKVRRWDQTGSGEIITGTEWIALEHGIEVCFNEDDEYHNGDYWLIPARAAKGIEWPPDTADRMPERFGIIHHYCPLATMKYTDDWELIKECRRIFPNITELITLTYAGGDGQEAMPGEPLPAPLEVRVIIGKHPIKDVRVRFSIVKGEGSLEGTLPLPPGYGKTLYKRTSSDGLASCGWILDKETQSQQVEATLLDIVLLDKDGDPMFIGRNPVHPSIKFNANLSVADQVAYNPADDCAYLIDRGVTTVQAAIDALCDCKEKGFYIHRVHKWKLDERKWVILGNYTKVLVDELKEGLHIECNENVDPSTVEGKCTCYITLYMPRMWNYESQAGVIGFQPLILKGEVSLYNSNNTIIFWNPIGITKTWLEYHLKDKTLQYNDVSKVLARLTLKGNFILAANDDHTLYLDGEAFGMENTDSNLDLPSGDGKRGGDFEMWFWLVEGSGIRYVEYNIPVSLLVENGLCQDGKKNCNGGTSGGRYYAMVGSQVALNGNSDVLVDLLINEGVHDDHLLHDGESLNLTEGFTLTALEIDVDSEEAWFSLTKDGEEISSEVVKAGEFYTHIENEIMGETDVPVFVTFVETVFAGPNTNLVKITSTWLISMDVMDV
jgi:hypothetical protein